MGLNQLLVQSLSNPAESPRLVHVAVETEYRVMPGVTGEYGIRPGDSFLPGPVAQCQQQDIHAARRQQAVLPFSFLPGNGVRIVSGAKMAGKVDVIRLGCPDIMIAGCDEERQAKPVHRSHGICPLFGAFAVIDHVACMQERLYVSGAALLLHPRGHRRKGAGITLRIHLRVADPGDGKSGCGSLAPFSVRLGERTASFSRLGEECPDRWGRQWVPCQGAAQLGPPASARKDGCQPYNGQARNCGSGQPRPYPA